MAIKGKTAIIIRITPKMKTSLIELAKQERRTVSNYIRLLIENRIREYQGLPPIKTKNAPKKERLK